MNAPSGARRHLTNLVQHNQVTRDPFDPGDQHETLDSVLDQINQPYGPDTPYFGGAHRLQPRPRTAGGK